MDTSSTLAAASACINTAALMDEFKAGVTACLRSWSALRTAVERGWGGHDSIQKAEDLRASILQHMDGSSGFRFPPSRDMMDVLDLEDTLAIFMEEEFSIVLEDGSEKQVAQVIWQMYHDCFQNGDVRLARQVVQEAQAAAAAAEQSPIPMAQIQSNESDDDDDEDDDAMEMAQDDDGAKVAAAALTEPRGVAPTLEVNPATSATNTFYVASEYAAQSIFGSNKPKTNRKKSGPPARQLGEAKPQEPSMEMDDDGFAPVVKKKGKK
jgi:pre-rRNA-processing protein TSR2